MHERDCRRWISGWLCRKQTFDDRPSGTSARATGNRRRAIVSRILAREGSQTMRPPRFVSPHLVGSVTMGVAAVLAGIILVVAGCSGGASTTPASPASPASPGPSATHAATATSSATRASVATLIPGCLPDCVKPNLTRPGNLPAGRLHDEVLLRRAAHSHRAGRVDRFRGQYRRVCPATGGARGSSGPVLDRRIPDRRRHVRADRGL